MDRKYLYGLAAAGLFLILSKTKTGQETITATVDAVSNVARGVRNKNPGNIKRSGEAWQGLAASQSDPVFFQFVDMKYGVRAMARIIKNYDTRYGLNTVRGIIGRWAPPSENNTGNYIGFVCREMGVQPDDEINVFDTTTLVALIKPIVKMENGFAAAALVYESSIREGVSLS